MIRACRDHPAIPFIRVPDATEGDIQKATDIGALGIIVPMVASVAKIEAAVRFAKFPPDGVRSQGGGQYRALWGDDYRATANDNIMIVAMIESPAGVAIAGEIAAVPGVDVVFAASTDLRSFSGWSQGDPQYEALIAAIRTAALGAGRASRAAPRRGWTAQTSRSSRDRRGSADPAGRPDFARRPRRPASRRSRVALRLRDGEPAKPSRSGRMV